MEKRVFIAEVKKQLALRKWSYKDLSEHTKYTSRSIGQMMYDESKMSPQAMNNIANALEIKLE